ncbi:MAG: exodeoxyribonuclease VII large subunit [Bacteroidales bacterium]|nr:exodeoxyribonuclease VII large subunit [Bacteroidales bacterium]
MEQETFNGKSVYTLTQVGQSIQSMIERTYKYPYYIKAEMVKLNLYARTGHCYPELVEKDGQRVKAQMRAVIWADQYTRINQRFIQITGEPMKDGITILCLATIQYSPQYGLALHIQDIEPTFTLGEMAKTRLETIARLKKEGIFDANKRTRMPLLPKRVAVISIETSKGYSDFTITLNGNAAGYRYETTLFPSLLQGEKAIATMLEQLDRIEQRKDDFDCVAIIRGGGGDVGLGCYDNYELARRVATFPLPVLSGIGHSTNETITESVSYANKITPTEVAYFLIGKFTDFENKVIEYQNFITNQTLAILQGAKERTAQYESRLQIVGSRMLSRETSRLHEFQNLLQLSGRKLLDTHRQLLNDAAITVRDFARDTVGSGQSQLVLLQSKMRFYAKQHLENRRTELSHYSEKLELLAPTNILRRGFSITRHNGKAVTNATDLRPGDTVETTFMEGTRTMTVEK